MDIARRPYSTDARFFKDSDTVTRVRWYPVAEPVEVLPFPSKINSLDWSSFPWLAEGVGEVFGPAREYNGAKALPYAVGLTPCQPASVFLEGEHYDPALPPQSYNSDHFPSCCLNITVGKGGELDNGAAVVEIPVPVDLHFDPSCAAAGPNTIVIGGEYRSAYGLAGTWVRLTTVPPGGYRIRLVDLGPNGQGVNLWSGNCGAPVFEDQLFAVGQTSAALGTGGVPVFGLTFFGPSLTVFERITIEVIAP